MKKSELHSSSKAVLGFLIVLVAFSILAIFALHQENIIETGSFKSFIMLSAIGLGLLLGLWYLVSNSQTPTHKKRKSR